MAKQSLIVAEELDAYQEWRERENLVIADRIRVAHERMLAEAQRRTRAISNAQKAVFIAALASGLTILDAADVADCAVSTLYRTRHADSGFALAWDDAIEASCAPIEKRLEAIALTGAPDSMATVRAAEVTLKHRAGRRYNQGSARVEMKSGPDGGSLSVRVGTPGLD